MAAPAARLHSGFLEAVSEFPARPALILRGESWTYAELDELARRWAAALVTTAGGLPRRVGLFAHKSLVSYAGMLAALYAGATVVPLNRTFLVARTAFMATAADLDALIVDEQSSGQLTDLLTRIPGKLEVITESVMAWQCGGCVIPLDTLHLLAPFDFVREHTITLWLPGYVVPRRVFVVPDLPLNVNGKVDRMKLRQHVLRNR